jgi:hypothetical protein
MGKVKQIYMEIQEKYGEDVEVTEELFGKYLDEKQKEEESK